MRTAITFSWRALLVFAVYVLAFWLLIRIGTRGDLLLRGIIWAVILILSVLLLNERFRHSGADHRRRRTFLQRWNRWAMDESDDGPPEQRSN